MRITAGKTRCLPAAFHIIGKSFELPYDTKMLRKDAQGLPQRSEGTQTQRKLSLESDAFAAQNAAKQDSYIMFALNPETDMTYNSP